MSESDELRVEPYLPCQAENAGLFISRGQGIHPTRVLKSYELIFVQQGMLAIREDHREFVVKSGESLLLFPGRKHGGSGQFPKDLRFYWVHFNVTPVVPPGAPDTKGLVIAQHSAARRPERLVELFRWFLDDQEAGRLDSLSGAMILTMMLREISDARPNRGEGNGAGALLANRADSYIRTNFHSDISARVVATHLGCNPDYLCRVFKVSYSMTLTDAIQMVRVRHAKELLLDSEMNIDQLARSSGFSDPGYFRRLFKRQEGVTPKAYRRLYGRVHVNTH